jgi:hypothetical protein
MFDLYRAAFMTLWRRSLLVRIAGCSIGCSLLLDLIARLTYPDPASYGISAVSCVIFLIGMVCGLIVVMRLKD